MERVFEKKSFPGLRQRIFFLMVLSSPLVLFAGVLDSLLSSYCLGLQKKTPVQASFRRIQTYRKFTFSAEGSLLFDSANGIQLKYTKPFQMKALYNDSGRVSIHEKSGKQQTVSWNADGNGTDPVHALSLLMGLHRFTPYLKASFDSIYVYEGVINHRRFAVSLDKRRLVCTEIMFTDNANRVLEKNTLHYKTGRDIPVSVVSRKVLNGTVLTDSLVLGKPVFAAVRQ